MKKLLAIITVLTVLMTGLVLTGCNGDTGGGSNATSGTTSNTTSGTTSGDATTDGTTVDTASSSGDSDFDTSQFITVISRAEDSGTRSAFVEIVGVVNEDGKDDLTQEAEIQENGGAVLTVVEQNQIAIGYISFGSLNPRVRALSINGTAATEENIRNGSYGIQRPFNVAHNGNLSDAAEDFWNFIFSAEGQAVVGDSFIEGVEGDAPEFVMNGAAGKVVVGGSTSVEPIMQKLAEEYAKIGGTAAIEVHAGGSSTGESNAADGTFDIGMISREVRVDSLTHETLAIDGIAIIVNTSNSLTDISVDDLREIFLGNYARWNDVG
jgi:phosphate transport system substrate-binding protein